MFVNAAVVLPPQPDMMVLPETAVDYTLYGDSVYVIREDGKDANGNPILKAVRTPIKTGARWGNNVAILDGLEPGDRVVAAGQVKVQNGAQVAISNSPAPQPPHTAADAKLRTMSFTDIFIRRPVLALVVSLLILLIGLKAMTGLQIRQYPKLSNTTITVTTIYPGASPDLMQGFITTPISQAVSTAEGIDYLTASSIQGTSTVTAYIRLNYDPSQALTDIMAKVQQVKFQLPKESQDPVIIKSTGQTTAVMYIGFASPELSSAAISDYLTRVVQPLLATVDGVASADILGGQTFAMRLWLDPARMAARGISASDVAAAIRANNFQSAPGQAKGYFTITNVNADTGLANVQQFTKMVVKAKDGAVVRMEDIASVDLNAQSWTSSIEMNGQHAVFIGVQATPTGNPLSLVAGIRALLPEIERNLPASVKMQVAYEFDQIHSGLDRRGQIYARRRGRHRHRRDFPVPRQPASSADPGRDDTAVAGRRRNHHGGAGVQSEPIDAACDGACDRARRRRRDRRPRERLSPYRRGPHPGAGGADRRP